MFSKFRSVLKGKSSTEVPSTDTQASTADVPQPTAPTKSGFGAKIKNLFAGNPDRDTWWPQLETLLIQSDFGLDLSVAVVKSVRKRSSNKDDFEAVKGHLRAELTDRLSVVDNRHDPLMQSAEHPRVLMVLGVNGVGKTTTIGKLAHYYQSQGLSVALAAGDTFRAAAGEQLKTWGERNNVPVIAQQHGADSAAVVFDAYQSSKAREVDLLIVDTAGRLHNKSPLMAELAKIKRTLTKFGDDLPTETMLVCDGTFGQNSLSQAQQFMDHVGFDGVIITKLDGSAKGGILFNLIDTLRVPVRFIGHGEGMADISRFTADLYLDQLLSD